MQYKNLGRSGLKVSQLSFGRWMYHGFDPDVKGVKSLLQCCHDHGVNFFDLADEINSGGRSEVLMGQAIRELGWKRSDFVISTKIYSWPKRKPTKIYCCDSLGPNCIRLSRKHIVEETKASLRRLDMEYVDVIYCHRPDGPVEETVRAMNHVIDKGWALYWGTTEWSAKQIKEALAFANRLNLVGLVVEQTKYSLLSGRYKVEVKHMPLYSTYGIGLTTLSPLLSGALSEKYTKYDITLKNMSGVYMYLDTRLRCDDTLRKAKGLKLIADELDVTLPQLAIAWCALNPNVSSVIPTVTSESQIIENMKAINVIPKLTPEVLEKIDAVVQDQ